jgi:hypothetical protein
VSSQLYALVDLPSGGIPLILISWEAVRAPGTILTLGHREKYLALPGVKPRFLGGVAGSQVLRILD